MSITDDKDYDALLYVARCIELGHKNITWEVAEIHACEGKSGTTLESDGDAGEEKKKREDSARSSRSRFKAKASNIHCWWRKEEEGAAEGGEASAEERSLPRYFKTVP